MVTVVHNELNEVMEHFSGLEDPRSSINRRHPLVSVVVISLMGVLAGAGGPTSIALWAESKKEFLMTVLALPHGIPRKDVFRNVLMRIKPEAFQACFTCWIETLRAKAAAATGVDQPIFSVDGKTARRSHDRNNGLGALHSVSVWANEFGLSMGQVACEEKSNEITAIPEVLRLVDIEGAIVTIDAMGTQKVIAKEIIDGKADYVLALKDNHLKLSQAVADFIDKHSKNDFADVDVSRHLTEEKGHGREEIRSYLQMEAPLDLPGFELWAGLKTIGMVISDCIRNGKPITETRYFISSLELDAKCFANAVRTHWGIENTCHWTLDFTFREDESRIRDPHMRENFAWLNRFVLSLLKQYSGSESVVMRRRMCGWDENFMLQVLTGTTT